MTSKVLFVATHPDDETLGCGGTILRHKDLGDRIFWMVITNMDTNYGWKKEIVAQRQNEINEVARNYKFDKVFKLDFPTTKLDLVPLQEMIDAVSKVIYEIQPEIIYLPNRSDVHTDHQITFKVVYSCTKNFRYPFIKRILMYEVLSETDFAPGLNETIFCPNVYIDISNYLALKLKIIQIYESELMGTPYPRNIETIKCLAKYRGSRIGKNYAESFQLLFEQM